MRVAVVGAGPIGSTIARNLSSGGEDVTLIERKARPCGKACSGLVSESIWDFVPKKEGLIENTIDGIAIHFTGGTVTAKFKRCMLALDRNGLDAHLVRVAEKSGVELMLDHRFNGMAIRNGRVEASLSEKPRRPVFDRLVGCDGALSGVRKALGLPEPAYRLGFQCFQNKKDVSHTADAWPTPNGFFWRIPRRERVEWGLFERPRCAATMWKGFANKNGLDKLPLQVASIPEGVVTAGNGRVALCGDAAGLTKPWSGGGIVWGLTSAKLLLDKWPDIGEYERALRDRFGRMMFLGRIASGSVRQIGRLVPWLLPRKFDGDWLF